jgi:MoxR-like ATPase
MNKRLSSPSPMARTPEARAVGAGEGRLHVPHGLRQAPVLDLMCSHFVLTLAARQGPRFNVRRDLNTLLSLAGRHLVWPHTVLQRLREFLQRRCKDNELWAGHDKLAPGAFMDRYGVWRGPYEEGTLFFYLDEYAKEAPKDLLSVLAVTGEWLSQALKKQSTLVEKNIDALAELLQLNRAERALLLYGTLARYQRDLRSILVEFKVNNAPEAYAAIADVAGVKASEVGEALRAGSRLERIGMVENLISEHNITDLADLMKVSEKLPPVLMREYRSQSELMAVFTRPAAKSALVPADFDYVSDDVRLLSGLLREAVARKEAGVNVLLYGPPGTGKTELARVVAQAAGLALFEVEYADRDGNALSGRDRYRSLQIAQVFLKGTAQSALLFDEVEDVFPPISSEAAQFMARAEQVPAPHSHSVSGKAWVNQVLESNAVPTIWITNRIEQIDPAFRRRFAYHLELKSPPPGAREQLVRKTLDGVAVSEALIGRLTERKGLTPAQIRTAVRFAQLAVAPVRAAGRKAAKAAAAAPPALLDDLIERQLRHADRALGRAPDALQRPSVTQYSLAILNVESRHPIPRIIDALKARGHGCLCFHGAPGTGKTALAEHLAQQLGRPLMIRRASDLVGDRAADGRHVPRGRGRARGAAARRSRQLPAGPPRRAAHLRGDRGQRDAAGHGALRRHLRLHHQPDGQHRSGSPAPLHLQDPFQAAHKGAARDHVRGGGAGRRCDAAGGRERETPGRHGPALPGRLRRGQAPGRDPGRRDGPARVPRSARSRTPHQARGARSPRHRLRALKRHRAAAAARNLRAPGALQRAGPYWPDPSTAAP